MNEESVKTKRIKNKLKFEKVVDKREIYFLSLDESKDKN